MCPAECCQKSPSLKCCEKISFYTFFTNIFKENNNCSARILNLPHLLKGKLLSDFHLNLTPVDASAWYSSGTNLKSLNCVSSKFIESKEFTKTEIRTLKIFLFKLILLRIAFFFSSHNFTHSFTLRSSLKQCKEMTKKGYDMVKIIQISAIFR